MKAKMKKPTKQKPVRIPAIDEEEEIKVGATWPPLIAALPYEKRAFWHMQITKGYWEALRFLKSHFIMKRKGLNLGHETRSEEKEDKLKILRSIFNDLREANPGWHRNEIIKKGIAQYQEEHADLFLESETIKEYIRNHELEVR